MEDRKKICLVIPSLQAGGMERVMSELAWHFGKKENLEIHLLLYGITREMFFQVPDSVKVHIPPFPFNNHKRFFSTLKSLAFLRRKFRSIKPDSILSFGEYWNSFVLISAIGLKYPVFVSDRSQPDKSLGWTHDFLRRVLYRSAAGIILQSQKAKDIFRRRNKHRNIAVIGNPIRSILNGSPPVKREKSIVMVGRLIESKHQDILIEIFSKVYRPGWKLKIVGYDHLKQEHMSRLKKLAVDLGVQEHVEFLGKRDDIDEIFLSSSIFAFTSSSEGFPNVIGEAMSAALPVVSFDCVAGPSEMINDSKNGFLVPLFDQDIFADRLDKLIEDEDLRIEIGSQAVKDIKGFSIDIIGDRFLSFILNK